MNDILLLLGSLDLWTVIVAVVDITLVAAIIYRVLLLIRGTRAAYMLVGLLVMAGFFFVAQRFQLTTVRWLLDNVLNYLLLIVIIVFQADIRRGLMRMGRRLFSPAQSETTRGIEEVVALCDAMVRQRVGALIVFEREFGLDDLIQSGVEIDAQPSRELLINIFTPWPDNPLHDGAVIISNDRIRKAAALLPLSPNPNLDHSLGTRHRAGVGITEETDAISVVVSEQRASISVCSHGLIRMGLTVQVLRKELLALLSEQERTGGLVGRLIDALSRSRLRRAFEEPSDTPLDAKEASEDKEQKEQKKQQDNTIEGKRSRRDVDADAQAGG